jgi:ATP-dependent DNA helicase RecQ
VIFNDRTLREMIVLRPTTLDEMLTVGGVGKTRLDRYGEVFLSELNG